MIESEPSLEPTLADFTLAELARMQRVLRQRFGVAHDPNLIDVGFGTALKRNRLDSARGLAACFFVRTKWRPAGPRRAIPPRVRLRLRRRRRYELIWLATDIVEVGAVAPSGHRFSAPEVGPATAGAILVWQQRAFHGRNHLCGILTVGHAFPSPRRDLVLIQGPAGGIDFNGRLYQKSRRPSAVDAAIIQVRPQDLADNGILDAGLLRGGMVDPAAVAPATVLAPTDLATKLGARGTSLRDGRPQPFVLHALLPTMSIPTLGCLRNVLAVRARQRQAFGPGTSGAIWEIEDQAAALQVAATPPDFQHGFGQALAVDLTWARDSLAQTRLLVPGSLRLVTWV
ncbi:MAG: hypothetical protein A2W31_11090 [Planctomycetes bacterium RBG_16_64_10]|nr:MAG: hypothetical protein A2W31_11090 [Planctomycetes bacterium RBG_16_64_10]